MAKMSSELLPAKSKIQRYYEDKTILLTGGTGFLGKVLVEKLLRSCPNIRQIFLLVREKRGLSPEERLSKLLESEVFTRLKQDHPEFAKQLIVVPGDLSEPLLGLTPYHIGLLSQNVQVIFHSAATLRFDERLSIAITTNVAATKELCLLAQNMVNLEAFVYVSTAYCHCDTPLIEEKIRSPLIPPENLMLLPKLLGDEMLDEVTPSLLGSKPNTYIYTKCAAEDIVNSFKSSLPVAIFRPAIVLASVSEPIPGWIDNVLGPTGMVAGLSAGFVHTAHFQPRAKAHFVPVDYTVNGIIAMAYSVAQRQWESSDSLPIVNFVSTADNTITWGLLENRVHHSVWRNPSQKLTWYPFSVTTPHHWYYTVLKALLHHIPANIIDWVTAKLGRPTRLRHVYDRLDKYAAVVSYFCTREFRFEEKNAGRLWACLEPPDQLIFPFNMAELDWDSYIVDYVRGCRRFLLKEDSSTVEKSRKKIKILYFIHLATNATFFLLIAKAVFRLIGFSRRRGYRIQVQQKIF